MGAIFGGPEGCSKGGRKYDGDGERTLAFVVTFVFVDYAHDVSRELESRVLRKPILVSSGDGVVHPRVFMRLVIPLLPYRAVC